VQLLWATVVRERLEAPDAAHASKPPQPAGYSERLTRGREAATALVDALASAGDAEPMWTWFPADRSVGFVRRRQAHGALIHRIDAEQTSDMPVLPADPMLATDGVDEILSLTCEFVPFLSFDAEIRKIVCTTNAIWSTPGSAARSRPADTSPTRPARSVRLRGDHEPGPDRHRPATLGDPLETALNAFDIAFDGRLSAGRK
jgi:hypothetical protein